MDIYSFGLVFFEAITGLPPYRALTKDSLYARVIRGGERPDLYCDEDGYPIELSSAVRSLLAQSWSAMPAERPTAQHIVEALLQCETVLREQRATVRSAGVAVDIITTATGDSSDC